MFRRSPRNPSAEEPISGQEFSGQDKLTRDKPGQLVRKGLSLYLIGFACLGGSIVVANESVDHPTGSDLLLVTESLGTVGLIAAGLKVMDGAEGTLQDAEYLYEQVANGKNQQPG